jgi:formate-dependent phosphoribosylglycinamide formyltransferase (GAR transformylase)
MHVVFVAPFFMDTTLRFLRAVAELPGVHTSLVTQEPKDKVPGDLRQMLAGFAQVDDALSAGHIRQGVELLTQKLGKPNRLLGTLEHIQVQLAEVREVLHIPGLKAEHAHNFRDKARMKDALRAANLPCARHREILQPQDARDFVAQIGFPIVLKPREGVGAAVTFRVDTAEELEDALRAVHPTPQRAAVAEEFITGDEHSFEVVSVAGKPIWHSLTRYDPPPLDVLRNPWIQWTVLLPREVDGPQWDAVREVGFRALKTLGMQTGISHMEWFRRKDGTVAISEIAARPPGAQIMTLNSFAHDTDMYKAWARLVVMDKFAPLERKYAAGAAFFRGQGEGRVKKIHGLERAQKDLGHLVVESRLPQIGQPQATSYEGEGYAVLRHPETRVVENALRHLVSTVRVELG